MPLVMGVDCSTSATKVQVRDADTGRLVGEGRAAHPTTTPPRSEQDPAAWLAAWHQASAGLAAAAAADADAVAIGGQQHGMVALDADRHVIRPAKLWNDTESAADADWLIKKLGGPEAWADACGSVPVAAFTITKLSWLHRTEPDNFARIAHVCLPHDWLTLQLTGDRLVTDRGDASGTGYWSPAANAWRTDLLEIVDAERDWATALPEVLGPTDVAGRTVGGALVGPGTGDNMAAALSLALRPGDVVVSLGTSGTVFCVASAPTADASGAVAGFADAAGGYLPLVCTLNATKVTDTFATVLGVSHAELDALALAAPPGAGGVVLLPYLDGERTPNRPTATGVLYGLRPDTGREHLARAAVEGTVCGLLDGLDALTAAGVPTGGRLVLIGGGSRSAAYRQVLADLSGRTVEIPGSEEHVARGAAIQAAAVLSGATVGNVAAAWATSQPVPQVVEPRPLDVDVRGAYAVLRDGVDL